MPEPAANPPLADSVLQPRKPPAPRGPISESRPRVPSSQPHAPPSQDRGIPELLPLATAVAVCEAVEQLAPVEARVKWPNDVWIGGRKCAGILVEARPQDGWAVVGIGINLTVAPEDFPAEIRDRVTSVGSGATLNAAREALNQRLSHWIAQSGEAILSAFRRRDVLQGQEVEWAGRVGAVAEAGDSGAPSGGGGESGGYALTGTAQGVDGYGNLIVSGHDGRTHELAAGEVHLSGK